MRKQWYIDVDVFMCMDMYSNMQYEHITGSYEICMKTKEVGVCKFIVLFFCFFLLKLQVWKTITQGSALHSSTLHTFFYSLVSVYTTDVFPSIFFCIQCAFFPRRKGEFLEKFNNCIFVFMFLLHIDMCK